VNVLATLDGAISVFDPATWERLARIRDAYDPSRLIRANHA
jgi:hypothetical protein